jgi:hypothetical protein
MNRRDFFRRTTPIAAAVVLAPAAAAALAKPPSKVRHENGRIIVDGEVVILEGSRRGAPVEIRGKHVHIRNNVLHCRLPTPAIHVRGDFASADITDNLTIYGE